MAITQDRIATLVTAAKTYQDRHTVMVDVMVLLHQMMREGAISPAEAMERLFSQFSDKTISIEAAGVIEAEWTRYQITRKRNEYMKEYQRKRRGASRAPSDNASAALSAAPSDAGAFRAPYDDAAGAPCGAPSDDATANAMTLAEIEAAIARAGALRAPSDGASTNAAPGAFGAPSNEPEPSIAFNAELSVDDLL